MTTHWRHGCWLVAALALAGCGRKEPALPPGVAPEDRETRLGDPADVDLAGWLNKPRPELARLVLEWEKAVADLRRAAERDPRSVELLPRVLPPAVVPVFAQATYNTRAGFSLPAWLAEGKKDNAAALHLARFGDHEAAARLVDATVAARLAALRYAKNYPVEWTRLVGLAQAAGQLRLAAGDPGGAAIVVRVHEQLRSVLDAKAAAGPLGAALLPTGKRALELAARAWREPKRNKTALADDIEQAVAEWGPAPPLRPGLTEAAVAAGPAEVARAVDLLALPLSAEGVALVAAFVDSRGRVVEVQLVYRAKIDTLYPEPATLAHGLAERGYEAGKLATDDTLQRQAFRGDGLAVTVTRTNRSNALGGLVAVRLDGSGPAAVGDLRNVGPLCFDRGFERNRLALAPQQAGETIQLADAAARARLSAALRTPAPESARIERDKEYDVLRAARLGWKADEAAAVERLLPGLWRSLGVAALEVTADGPALAFVWQDEHTRARLTLPFDQEAPALLVEDRRAGEALKARAAAVRRRDSDARKARLATGKAELRLPRSPGGVNDFSLEKVELGQSRSQALEALPKGKAYRLTDVPEGVSLLILSRPPREAPYWARQVLLRFNAAHRLTEVRLRYEENLAPARRGETLLERLSGGRSGQPESVAATWGGLWIDVPPRGAVVSRRWQDDRSVRTYQSDGGLSEVVLRDRSREDTPPPAWSFVGRGVAGVGVGVGRSAVRAALREPAQRTADGADVHRMPASSPYEMVLVWYDNDAVSRLLAVHRGRPGVQDKEVAAALQRVWSQNLDGLGFIRHRDGRRDPVLGSYYWHDDVIRVRTSVQSDDEGGRLITEWRPWKPGA